MRQLRWGVGPGHQHWKLPLTPDTLFPPLPQVAWPVLGRRQLLPKEAVCLQAHNTLCTPPLPRISQLAASRGQSGGPGRGSGCLCHSAFQRGPCWAEPPRLASWGYKAGSPLPACEVACGNLALNKARWLPAPQAGNSCHCKDSHFQSSFLPYCPFNL